MIVKNSQEDLIFDIPDKFKNIGIKLSGGTDSAIILYLLCKYISDSKLDKIIIPFTAEKYIKPYHEKFSKLCLDFCKNEFPGVKFSKHYIFKQTKEEVTKPTSPGFMKVQNEMTIKMKEIMDCHFMGQTRNPPKELVWYDSNGYLESLTSDRYDTQDTVIIGKLG